MTASALVRDWIWVLAFFPLWLVTAGACFGLAYGPKKVAGVRMQKFLDSVALIFSVSAAAGALMMLECADYIYLPFAQPACRTAYPNLVALLSFVPM